MGRATTSDKSIRSHNALDAIALLKADHKAVEGMFKEYENLCSDQESSPEEKEDLAIRICAELTVHAQIEEELFYPALRKVLDEQDLLDEAEVEHATAKDLIAQLQEMDASDDMYDAKVTVLGEYINHHVEEEQGEMFKLAKKTKLDFQALGEKMQSRQLELKAELGLDDEDDYADEADEDDQDEGQETQSRRDTRAGAGSTNRRTAA